MAGWYGLPHVIALLFLFLGCLGFTNPNAAALCLAPFSKNAGTAASLLGCLQLGIGALASAGVSAFSSGVSATPMIAIIAVTSLIAMGILIIGKRSGKLPTISGAAAPGPLPH